MTVEAVHVHPVEHPSEHLVQNLATAVEGALWAYDPIRQTGTMLTVTTSGSVVTLTGNVRSDIAKSIATRLAMNVTGVKQVDNQLVADNDIEHTAAVVIAMDPESQLFTDQVNVTVIHGCVYLGGTASASTMALAEASKARAETLVRQIPGVLSVVNELRAVEGVAGAAMESDEAGAASAGAGGGDLQAVMQERMAIWRERAAQRG